MKKDTQSRSIKMEKAHIAIIGSGPSAFGFLRTFKDRITNLVDKKTKTPEDLETIKELVATYKKNQEVEKAITSGDDAETKQQSNQLPSTTSFTTRAEHRSLTSDVSEEYKETG